MQLHSRSWTFAYCGLTILLTSIGCSDTKSNAPDRNVSDSNSAALSSNDADVSSAQLVKLGEEKFDAKEYDEAIKFFTKAVEQNPRATNHAFIGDCYWKMGKLDQADVHYRRALEVDPNHCGASHALGRDAVLQERFEDAIPYLDKASEVCADTVLHAQNLRFHIEALVELDRVDDAESELNELIAKYPDDKNAHEAGLIVATKKGNTSLMAEYEKKLKANSKNDEPN